MKHLLVRAGLLCMLAGCGGQSQVLLPSSSSAAVAPVQDAGAAASASAKVTINIVVPSTGNVSKARFTRDPFFVAVNTKGVEVEVYKATDASRNHLLARTTASIAAGSPACGHVKSTPRTCSIGVSASIGDDAFVVTTYDAPPKRGAFKTAKELAAAVTDRKVVKGGTTFGVVLDGVVAQVRLSLPDAKIHGTRPLQQTLSVEALDASGNVIVTDRYSDIHGNPVTIALSQVSGSGSSAVHGGSSLTVNGGTVTLSSASLTNASESAVQLAYDGNAQLPVGPVSSGVGCQANPCDGSFVDTIAATPSNAATAAKIKLQTIGPKVTIAYQAASGNGFYSPSDIINGPQQNLWFMMPYYRGQGGVGKITTNAVAADYSVPADASSLSQACNGAPEGSCTIGPTLALGPDGNLWFTLGWSYSGGKAGGVGSVTPSGTISAAYPLPVASAAPNAITAGPDGNLWFATTNWPTPEYIGKVTTSGSFTEYPLPGAATQTTTGQNALTVGPDKNVWFTDQQGTVGKITTAGVVSEYTIPTANAFPFAIAPGPDGNLWFSEAHGPKIARMTTSGAIAEFMLSSGAYPTGITGGSDGNVWFADFGTGKIGRITTNGTVTEYGAIPGPVDDATNSAPVSIVTGPDGNLWFADSANGIGVFTW
jgi:streptogramin lyase